MKTREMGRVSRLTGRLLVFIWAMLLVGAMGAKAAAVNTTLVQDTLYRADGSAAQGTITIRWNAFSTSAGEAVAAGELTAETDANGGISIPLAPNAGATPGGDYYKVVIKLKDGSSSEEAWVVPATASTTLAVIRAKVVPQSVAAQFVSRDYVDGEIAGLATVASTGNYNDLTNKPAAPNLAAPGAIGSTTPAAVNATVVTAQSIGYGAVNGQYLVTEGDSLTAGYLLSSAATQSWPYKLSQQAFFKNRATLVNAAAIGSTCASMTARYATAVQPYKPNGTTITKAYLAVMVGRNDVASLAAPAIESCIDAYITQANADGFTTVLMTVMPSSVLAIGPTGAAMNVTAVSQSYTSGTNGYITLTAPNSFTGSGTEYVYLNGFTGAASYLNGWVGTVLAAGLSSTQFEALTGVETPFSTITQSGATFAQTTYSSWDSISAAQDAVRQQVNAYILQDNDTTLAKTPAMVVDAASFISNPNDPATTFDGTHFKPYVYAAMAESIAAKFNMSGGPKVPQPMNSNYNPIFQGEVTGNSLAATMPNNTVVGSSTSNAYVRTYGNASSGQFFTDAYNPLTSNWMNYVVRASAFQLSDSGNQNLLVDANGTTGLKGVRSNSVFAGPVGGPYNAVNPTSGTWAYLSGNSPATLRSYNFSTASDDTLYLRGLTTHFVANNGTDVGNFSATGLSTTSVAAAGNVTAGASITKSSPYVDIRAFGAKCDNTTDDTAALQAAITSINTTGGKILIPGTSAVPCYFANPTGIAWGNGWHVITLVIQGAMRSGTTFVEPGDVDLVGDSGGGPQQFQHGGQTASFLPPGNTFTLGTAVTAGAQTFTPSSTAGMAVGGAVTIVGNTSCSITSTTAVAGLMTAQLSGACHIAPGYNMAVAGTSDSNSNATQLVSQADYVKNTLTWYCAACVASTGGTATGPNEDTMETVTITAMSGATVSAVFNNAHSSTDAGGVVGLNIIGGNHHEVRDISVGNAGGVGIWIGGQVATCCGDSADNVVLRNVAATGANGVVTSQAIEISNAIDIYMDHTVATIIDGYGSWGLRITNPQMLVGSTGGAALVTIDHSFIRGGIKADHYTIFSNIAVKDSVVEETRRGALTIQPNAGGTGTVYSILFDNVLLQDNFHYYSIANVYYTQPLDIGSQVAIKNNSSGLGAGAYQLVNSYFDGQISGDGSLSAANGLPATFGGRMPLISRNIPGGNDAEERGEGANLGPSIIPFATQAVTTSPASWSGTYCSVATGVFAPDGTATAGTVSQSGGTGAITLGAAYSTTPVVGDYILYGGWTKNPSGASGASLALSNTYQQQILFDGVATEPVNDQWADSEWHPVVSLSQITSIPSSGFVSHPALVTQCSSNASIWMPFMIYVPASAGVSQQELMRWRKQLLHGVVPPGLPANVLGMNSTHKLYWGSDTNLYRGAAGVVQTDGSFNVASGQTYQVGGSQIKTSALADWTNAGVANGSVPIWNSSTNQWTPGANGSGGGALTTAGGQTLTAADTVSGLSTGCMQYPCVVAKVAPTTYSGTAGTSGTFLTTPSAGVYRMCVVLSMTVAGTAGQFQVFAQYTGDGHYLNFGDGTISVATTTQWNTAQGCTVGYSDSGTVIGWYMSGNAVTGTPTVRYGLTLERMQ